MLVPDPSLLSSRNSTISQFNPDLGWWLSTWNNGREVPRFGVAEIQKMSTSTTAAVILSNKGVVLEFWEM